MAKRRRRPARRGRGPGVIRLHRSLRGVRICDRCGSHASNFIGCDRHAEASPANEDPPIGHANRDRFGNDDRDVRIVDVVLADRAVIDDVIAELDQMGLDPVFQHDAVAIRADRYAHLNQPPTRRRSRRPGDDDRAGRELEEENALVRSEDGLAAPDRSTSCDPNRDDNRCAAAFGSLFCDSGMARRRQELLRTRSRSPSISGSASQIKRAPVGAVR